MNVLLNALYQNCINGSAPLNRRAARALDKKSFKQPVPELLVQIQDKFTQLFLMMPSTKNCTNGSPLR